METHNSTISTPTSQKLCISTTSSVVSKVRVVVRVRPFLSHELTTNVSNKTSCVTVFDENCVSKDEVTVFLKDPETSRSECYQLDSFFGQDDNNLSKIFETEVSPLIPGIFCGWNATVFAYGATGSGKTYTMQGTRDLPGLMPLALSKILSVCEKTGSSVEISYYEVYMDRCYDLLELKAKEIMILDDKDGQTHLRGLSRVPVSSMSEFQEVLSLGFQRRKIAHTGLNDVSSRSHGVLVINVSTPLNNVSGPVVTGKLNLIDLAGNEDNRRTCNEGIRLQESAKINQSLFALSNVIYALNNNKPRVPYRESKLTRILQDSLGGNSCALMVACLNPGEYQEAVQTVSLAARSRHISNFVSPAHKKETPNVKVDMEAKLRAWLESKGRTKSAQKYVGTPFPTGSVKKLNYNISAKAKVNTNRGASGAKQREQSVPSKNLFVEKDFINSFLDLCNCVSEDNREVNNIDSAHSTLDSTETLPVYQSKKDEKATCTDSHESIQCMVSSPLRKALSPVNTNVDIIPQEQQDQKHSVETKTPKKVPSLSAYENEMMIKTPLNKFNVMSSALKNSLAQGYLDFLNTATREELIEIKGIGTKTAEYIIDLRQTSPLKSLNDLEKIGLSYKQVHNMFNRAAKGLFDGATPNTIINQADS